MTTKIPRTFARVRGWLAPVGLGLSLWGLLAGNAALRRADWDLANLSLSRRYWEDLTIATVNYQRGTGYLYRGAAWDWWGAHVRDKLKESVPDAAHSAALQGWQFWRTVPCHHFDNAEPMRLRDSDDPGRAWLTTWGFHLLGGVAPYLPLWLGILVALPLFVWLSLECHLARCDSLAMVTLALLAFSPYAAELLTLPYSAAGFHLLGLLLVLTLAVHALLGPQPSWRGLASRWLPAGLLFAVCVLCRGTCRSFLPALAVTACVAAWRTARPLRRLDLRVAAGALLALALLLGPLTAIGPAQQHAVWFGVWEGLGDFDREKGHAWYDPVARQVLRNEGVVIQEPIQPESTAQMEAIMRRLFLRDVASDPAWYARILARRVPATLLQLRLWPRASRDGTPYAKSTHANEGITNAYYTFVPTADRFGLGRWTWEAPLPLLWLPLLLVIGCATLGRRLDLVPAPRLVVLGLVAMAAATMPILFTTASGPETQAFVLVYFLAAGLLIEAAARAVRARRASSPREK